jgi:hypothetical protein
MQDENSGRDGNFQNQGGAQSTGTSTTIKEKARETKDRVMSKGSEAINRAKERGRSVADEQKNHLGERIHGYSSAVRRSAQQLREGEDPNIAHYAEAIADKIDQAADYVQSRDPGMILRDVENAARRRPEIFLGGMLLAGLVLGRFLKASNQRDDTYASESDEDYWVEDENSTEHPSNEAFGEQPAEVAPADTGFEMRSGEAAGDWKLNQQPGANS